ncbi:hypothetical protein ZWY2020_012470 [Hordeum vulgare]|nr:hypothetical protein ZWY2020_012470 [Hordeum vulgare]
MFQLLVVALAAGPIALPGCPESCGHITVPYPFGISKGCYHEGFGLTCDETRYPPRLFLGDGMEVLGISLTDGTVRIRSKVLRSSFSEFNGSWSGPAVTWPFSVSSAWNWFVAIGCNIVAQLGHPNGIHTQDGGQTSTCAAVCQGYQDDFTDIDECLQPDVYPCNGTCINMPGAYLCSAKKRIISLPGLITIIAVGAGFGLLFSLLAATASSPYFLPELISQIASRLTTSTISSPSTPPTRISSSVTVQLASQALHLLVPGSRALFHLPCRHLRFRLPSLPDTDPTAPAAAFYSLGCRVAIASPSHHDHSFVHLLTGEQFRLPHPPADFCRLLLSGDLVLAFLPTVGHVLQYCRLGDAEWRMASCSESYVLEDLILSRAPCTRWSDLKMPAAYVTV